MNLIRTCHNWGSPLTYSYTLADTRTKFKTLILKSNDSGRDIRLHSAYDPVKEATRSVEQFDPGRSDIILVSGLALAYHVDELKKKFSNKDIVVIEPDKNVIFKCRENNASILKNLSIINLQDDIERIFDTLDLSSFRGIAHYTHRPSYQINSEFYDAIIDNIKLYISSRVSDLLTRFEFEKKWIKNIFKNIQLIHETIGVSNFFNRFRGKPGIIVSAGPSLRKNIELLRSDAIQNGAVIIAVDTAIKVMSKYGIEPHFVMSLDAQKYSQKHFNGICNKNTVLIGDIVCCHSVLKTFNGRKTVSTTAKYYQNLQNETIRETTPSIDWFEEFLEPFGDIQSGGSVATSAFDFLLNCGCSKIILLGQDLAYTGREIHCSGTYHNDDWLPGTSRIKNLDTINQNIIRRRKTRHITAYGGETVISDFVFDLYKSWFEDSSKKVSIDIINSTEGGCRIQNTYEEELSYALKDLATGESTWSIIENTFLKIKNISKNKIDDIFRETLNSFNKIKMTAQSTSDAEEIMVEINKLIEDHSISKLVDPLLRKTNIYIARNEINTASAAKLIIDELKIISDFYINLLKDQNITATEMTN